MRRRSCGSSSGSHDGGSGPDCEGQEMNAVSREGRIAQALLASEGTLDSASLVSVETEVYLFSIVCVCADVLLKLIIMRHVIYCHILS